MEEAEQPAEDPFYDGEREIASGESHLELVRVDVLQRSLAILAAEKERTGVRPSVAAIDRVSERLKLTPAEIVALRDQWAALDVEDNPDEEDDAEGDGSSSSTDDQGICPDPTLLSRMLDHRLLTQDSERELGRAVRLAQEFEEAISTGAVPSSETSRQIIARGRDAQATLVQSNVRLAMDIARKYEHRGLELDDLLQEGIIGLTRAVESFDPNLGFRFSTYATWWIRQSIGRAVSNNGRTVRFPVHICDKLQKLKKADRKLRARTGSAMPEALATELGWPVEEVGKLLVWGALHDVPIDFDDDEGGSLLDRLVSPISSPDEYALSADLREFIERCLAEFDPRTAEIMRQRFGFGTGSPKTLEEVGQRFDLTRERIRQIEAKTLKKLWTRHRDDFQIFTEDGQ